MNTTQEMRSLDAIEIDQVAGGTTFWRWLFGDDWKPGTEPSEIPEG
ncbi:hypothetical protein [Qipengyuania flava]|nr:hypothetical protein [Qipengyuania flava]QYJ07595.1 hypothetical protein KUV82_02405 [Qipengyuania flava]